MLMQPLCGDGQGWAPDETRNSPLALDSFGSLICAYPPTGGCNQRQELGESDVCSGGGGASSSRSLSCCNSSVSKQQCYFVVAVDEIAVRLAVAAPTPSGMKRLLFFGMTFIVS